MITINADSRNARATSDDPITTGSVGIPVHVILSAEWEGLESTLTFRAGAAAADVPLIGQKVTIPAQCLMHAGKELLVGVYGARTDGTIVIPTIWANAGIIKEGTYPSGVHPAEPEPSWAAQVQKVAQEALDEAKAAKSAMRYHYDVREIDGERRLVIVDTGESED